MSDLQITHSLNADGTTLTVTVQGRLAIDTAAELQHLLMEQLDTSSSIILDISGTTEVDLAGIQVICSACRTALDGHKHFNFASCKLAAETKKTITDIGIYRQVSCKHNADQPCIWYGGIN